MWATLWGYINDCCKLKPKYETLMGQIHLLMVVKLFIYTKILSNYNCGKDFSLIIWVIMVNPSSNSFANNATPLSHELSSPVTQGSAASFSNNSLRERLGRNYQQLRFSLEEGWKKATQDTMLQTGAIIASAGFIGTAVVVNSAASAQSRSMLLHGLDKIAQVATPFFNLAVWVYSLKAIADCISSVRQILNIKKNAALNTTEQSNKISKLEVYFVRDFLFAISSFVGILQSLAALGIQILQTLATSLTQSAWGVWLVASFISLACNLHDLVKAVRAGDTGKMISAMMAILIDVSYIALSIAILFGGAAASGGALAGAVVAIVTSVTIIKLIYNYNLNKHIAKEAALKKQLSERSETDMKRSQPKDPLSVDGVAGKVDEVAPVQRGAVRANNPPSLPPGQSFLHKEFPA